MTVRKRAFFSAVTGLVLSGMGFLLVAIGGWGPCGPASTTAYIGGILGYGHCVYLCTWFPKLDSLFSGVDSVAFNVAVIILVPAMDWLLVTFGLLTVWQKAGDLRGRLAGGHKHQ